MPELPEVETMVRRFRPLVEGRRIEGFRAAWAPQALPSPRAVKRGIVGRTVARMGRRGKYAVLHLDDGCCLLVHFRMSGRFEHRRGAAGRNVDHVRAVFELSDGGILLFCDARKFGRIRYARSFEEATAHLGLEPLGAGFTLDALAAALRSRRRRLKPLLLDQSVVAGLGNIYADEALHRARLHALRRSDTVSRAEAAGLRRAVRRVLREAIRRCGTSIDWIYPGGRMQEHLRVYGRGGRPCRRCGETIRVIRVAQRSTHLCPACQV